MRWQKIVTLILGLWFVISAFLPYILGMPADLWNNFFVGILVIIFGLLMIRHVNFSVVVIILSGIWISVISFVPVFITKAGNMVNSLLVGILIVIMSLIQRKQV
ncbi:MAG: SPW repeat domain-containing protein [Athalassotoga sp.]|uniref:SPW repeat domain-containing protein n=1 Tax=Athalassotoga sp. TaxID=2022597 RepID=UPI003CFBCC8F